MIKTKQPIVQLGVLSLLLIIGAVVFYYTQNQIRREGLARTDVDQLTTSRQRLTELESLLPRYSLQEKSWLSTLPQDEEGVAEFARSLEQLARTNALVLAISFDDFPGPIDVSGHYIAGVGAEITLEGSYTGVSNFLAGLAELPYYFKVDKVTLTKPSKQPGIKAQIDGSLMMNIEI